MRIRPTVCDTIYGTIFLMLAGCGGATITTPKIIPSIAPEPKLLVSETSTVFETQVNAFEIANAQSSQASVSPLTTEVVLTSVTYSGLFRLNGVTQMQSSAELVGNAKIIANLTPQTQDITGIFTDFLDQTGGSFDGTIRIENGEINLGIDSLREYSFSADLSGELMSPQNENIQVQGGLDGDFRGSNYQYSSGNLLLVLENDSQSETYYGVFSLIQ